MNKMETLLNELGQALMSPENSSYNGITEKQSSISYRMKIEQLYSNAVSELYGLNDTQHEIAVKRIVEVRENQKHFDIPSIDTVNSMLRDYNNQAEGKRNEALLDDYRYCKFVLECVTTQRDYLEKIASLVNTEVNQGDQEGHETVAYTTNVSKADNDKGWLSLDETASKYRLALVRIKDRKWRIANDFPYKGYDETKGTYNKVVFNSNDVEDWIKNHKNKGK